jgi:hypothetical protein
MYRRGAEQIRPDEMIRKVADTGAASADLLATRPGGCIES